jgi:hypothetical protein
MALECYRGSCLLKGFYFRLRCAHVGALQVETSGWAELFKVCGGLTLSPSQGITLWKTTDGVTFTQTFLQGHVPWGQVLCQSTTLLAILSKFALNNEKNVGIWKSDEEKQEP